MVCWWPFEARGRAQQLGGAKDLTHKGRCRSRVLLVGEGQTGNGPNRLSREVCHTYRWLADVVVVIASCDHLEFSAQQPRGGCASSRLSCL